MGRHSWIDSMTEILENVNYMGTICIDKGSRFIMQNSFHNISKLLYTSLLNPLTQVQVLQ